MRRVLGFERYGAGPTSSPDEFGVAIGKALDENPGYRLAELHGYSDDGFMVLEPQDPAFAGKSSAVLRFDDNHPYWK